MTRVIFAAAALVGLGLMILADRLIALFDQVIVALALPALVAVWGAVGLGLLAGAGWVWHRWLSAAYDRRLRLAEVQRVEREANVWTEIAAPGSLVIRHHTNDYPVISTPLQLAAGPVNGAPSAFKQDELQRWAMYTLANAQGRGRSAPALAAPEAEAGPDGLQPLLPLLVPAQRLLIAGASGAGKSNLAKHIIYERSRYSNIVVIDPHAPSDVLGYEAIGAGRDYEKIANALEALLLMMDDRYIDVKAGRAGYFDHDHVTVVIDEWTSICANVASAGDMLTELLTESRKVNIHLVLMLHALTKDIAGVGPQVRASSVQVELVGGQHPDDPRRAFVLPSDGSRRRDDKTEYRLPGPFDNSRVPRDKVVLALPDARVLRAEMMAAEGASLSAIAREFYDVATGSRPSGRQINEVKALLDRARQARVEAAA